jgi:cell wall-associated NlpC family hydrolase
MPRLQKAFFAALIGLAFGVGCAGVPKPSDTHMKLYKAINTYLKAPYRWGGNTASGIDCSGFVKQVYGRAGIELPRTAKEQHTIGKGIKRMNDLKYGDVVFFAMKKRKEKFLFFFTRYKNADLPTHNGTFLGDYVFVHASSSQGVTLSLLNDPYWQFYFIDGRRYLD